MFFKSFDLVYYRITMFIGNFTAFNVKAIYNKTERFPQFRFLPKLLYHFQHVLFFHLLVSFQRTLVLRFSKNNYYLVYVKVVIKVHFCLLIKDTHREKSTLMEKNSSAYEKNEYGHLGRWYIK